jgi:4,5-DOPA dioxygenase extradiol
MSDSITPSNTMSQLPSVFVSHGAPDLPLRSSPARDFLQQLGHQIEPPKAILVISAHWGTQPPTVSIAPNPRTIHDFSGFPAELYQMNYPVPGAPDLAHQVVELLTKIGCEISSDRGLDHGAWVPLMLGYPEANIPVTQLSIQPHLSTHHHFHLGQLLEPLRHEGVLILASGSAAHNLRAMNANYRAKPPQPVTEFVDWLTHAIAANGTEALLHYRQLAPYAIHNHPSEEHLLPLFVAMGAGGSHAKGAALHSSFVYGALSMAAYSFS